MYKDLEYKDNAESRKNERIMWWNVKNTITNKVIALQELRWKELGKSINLNIHSVTAATQKKQVNLEMDSWSEMKLKRIS